MMIHGTPTLRSTTAFGGQAEHPVWADLRFFLKAYAGGLAFFLAMLL